MELPCRITAGRAPWPLPYWDLCARRANEQVFHSLNDWAALLAKTAKNTSCFGIQAILYYAHLFERKLIRLWRRSEKASKTKKSVASGSRLQQRKRFCRSRAGKRHLLQGKSAKRRRSLRGTTGCIPRTNIASTEPSLQPLMLRSTFNFQPYLNHACNQRSRFPQTPYRDDWRPPRVSDAPLQELYRYASDAVDHGRQYA